MTNIINSQDIRLNNTIHYGKKSQPSEYIQAPQSLPKYSLNDVLNEKDEFRKNVLRQQKQTHSKPKFNFKRFASVSALTGLIIFLLTKKK